MQFKKLTKATLYEKSSTTTELLTTSTSTSTSSTSTTTTPKTTTSTSESKMPKIVKFGAAEGPRMNANKKDKEATEGTEPAWGCAS
jgi:hypothetical protein